MTAVSVASDVISSPLSSSVKVATALTSPAPPLAKAKRVGASEAEIFPGRTVNLKGASVALEPCGKAAAESWGVWGAWTATLAVPGEEPVRVKVCDFQSAGDDPRGEEADAFSIWF